MRLARQLELIAHLFANGHDTTLAETVHDTMAKTLDLAREHRDRILRELDGSRP